MLACQFHQSSARAARVRFPADAAFLLERESQAFKQSGIHLWMAVNKGGKDNVFSMGGGRGRGGGGIKEEGSSEEEPSSGFEGSRVSIKQKPSLMELFKK